MSMIGEFLLIPDPVILGLQADPEWANDFPDEIHGDDSPWAADHLDVDKAWHGIHFMLTQGGQETDPRLGFLLSGGVAIGEDWGYGPPRAFLSAEAAAITGLLEKISPEDLGQRFDPPAMDAAEIYPMAGRWSEDSPDYYQDNYADLLALLRRGRSEAKGLLVWLS